MLHCIRQLAGTGTRHSVWRGMTDKLAEATAVCLDSAQTSAVREAAAQVDFACAVLMMDVTPALVASITAHACHWPSLAFWCQMPEDTMWCSGLCTVC